MQSQNPACPSCGFQKDHPEKTLCFYCYWRGNMGTMKMLILDILDKSPERLTLNEIIAELNKLPFIGREIQPRSLKENLRHYKHLGLITGRKQRVVRHCRGRQKMELKLTVKGKKSLERYRNNWNLGMVVPIKFRGKSKRITHDFKARASGIRGKIGKEYGMYEFIFPERRKL